MIAPTTHTPRTNHGRPKSPARNPVVVKMPVPIMFAITRAVAWVNLNSRRREGLVTESISDSMVLLQEDSPPRGFPSFLRRGSRSCGRQVDQPPPRPLLFKRGFASPSPWGEVGPAAGALTRSSRDG